MEIRLTGDDLYDISAGGAAGERAVTEEDARRAGEELVEAAREAAAPIARALSALWDSYPSTTRRRFTTARS